jgi:hypothetical protein
MREDSTSCRGNCRSIRSLSTAENYGGSSRQTKYASIHIQISEIPITQAKAERRKKTTTSTAGIASARHDVRFWSDIEREVVGWAWARTLTASSPTLRAADAGKGERALPPYGLDCRAVARPVQTAESPPVINRRTCLWSAMKGSLSGSR